MTAPESPLNYVGGRRVGTPSALICYPDPYGCNFGGMLGRGAQKWGVRRCRPRVQMKPMDATSGDDLLSRRTRGGSFS